MILKFKKWAIKEAEPSDFLSWVFIADIDEVHWDSELRCITERPEGLTESEWAEQYDDIIDEKSSHVRIYGCGVDGAEIRVQDIMYRKREDASDYWRVARIVVGVDRISLTQEAIAYLLNDDGKTIDKITN